MRIVAGVWLLVALYRLPWSYYVASRMWHGEPFAVGAWGRTTSFLTVLCAPIGAALVWKGREVGGSVLLLLVAINWIFWEFSLLWDLLDIRDLGLEHLAYLALSLLTVLLIGIHAVLRAVTNDESRE